MRKSRCGTLACCYISAARIGPAGLKKSSFASACVHAPSWITLTDQRRLCTLRRKRSPDHASWRPIFVGKVPLPRTRTELLSRIRPRITTLESSLRPSVSASNRALTYTSLGGTLHPFPGNPPHSRAGGTRCIVSEACGWLRALAYGPNSRSVSYGTLLPFLYIP